MFTFNFEKLDVWQEAIRFANLIYEITAKFPNNERFGLRNQMRQRGERRKTVSNAEWTA